MNITDPRSRYHRLWSEAMVVYLHGLSTRGKLSDPEGKKSGWQHSIGDQGIVN
jgi:polyhydroxybutyrate depolymerase